MRQATARPGSAISAMTVLAVLVPGWQAAAQDNPPQPRLKPEPPAQSQPVDKSGAADRAAGPGVIGSGARAEPACLKRLRGLGAMVTAEKPIRTANGCRIDEPVKLSSVRSGGDIVTLVGGPVVNCGFAVRLARWSANVVLPLARHHLGSPVSHMHVGPGYVCRGRNGATTGKLSEHAFGNALDIVGLTLANGTKVMVVDDPTATGARRKFFSAMRTSACGYFTTVLGPGANAAHASHYHVDLGKHGRSDHYRICE